MTWEQLREEVHKHFKFASPFRMGIAAGELDVEVQTPYPPGSNAAECFKEGIKHGRGMALRQQKETQR